MENYNKKEGNIEIRKCFESNRYEIVKWYPNTFYNKESDYIFCGDYYHPKDKTNIHISPKCFMKPEHCYVIAFIDMKNNNPHIKIVDKRRSKRSKLKEDDKINYQKIVDDFLNNFK